MHLNQWEPGYQRNDSNDNYFSKETESPFDGYQEKFDQMKAGWFKGLDITKIAQQIRI